MILRKTAFWKKLKRETPHWLSAGIINADQQQKILELYAPKPKDVRSRISAVVIGLAVILIGAGLILFYAANWKTMTPAVKLIQVFSLILCTYGLSFYFLAILKTSELIGRAFLLLGMVSFGVGIVLVAQIYHISSHPTNGILAWAVGALAMSWVMREKWGCYLTFLLAFIWNSWEITQYHNPNYLFVLFPAILLYLFYREGARFGVLLSVFALLFWYHQINFYWLDTYLSYRDEAVFGWLYIPLGVILVTLGGFGARASCPPDESGQDVHDPLSFANIVMRLAGWTAIFLPLMAFSWPEDVFHATFPFFSLNILTAEYILLWGIAAGLVCWQHSRGGEVRLAALCVGYGLFVFIFPLGNLTVLMILTHLGLLAYFFGLLYASYLHFPERRIERFLAFAFPFVMILSKGIGFFAYGVDSYKFFVAYCIGFIIFGTVCLLINQSVKLLVMQQNREFPAHILNGLCALTGFLMLYALSFEVEHQTSVFHASSVVVTLLVMFLLIALGLYAFLWLKSPDKLILGLSSVIFFTSVFVLVISGPGVYWIVYSLIFNILLFLMTATPIYYSTRIDSVKLLNMAIAGFLLHVFTRYVDIFWDMMSGSVLFISTGLLALIGGYFLERSRRQLVQSMREE